MRQVLQDNGLPAVNIEIVITMEVVDGGIWLFKTLGRRHAHVKHGEGIRLRYDPVAQTTGFSQERFVEWWNGSDTNDDNKIDHDEMAAMLGKLEVAAEDEINNTGILKEIKKSFVFLMIYCGLGGREAGIDASTFEAMYVHQTRREPPPPTALPTPLVSLTSFLRDVRLDPFSG